MIISIIIQEGGFYIIDWKLDFSWNLEDFSKLLTQIPLANIKIWILRAYTDLPEDFEKLEWLSLFFIICRQILKYQNQAVYKIWLCRAFKDLDSDSWSSGTFVGFPIRTSWSPQDNATDSYFAAVRVRVRILKKGLVHSLLSTYSSRLSNPVRYLQTAVSRTSNVRKYTHRRSGTAAKPAARPGLVPSTL